MDFDYPRPNFKRDGWLSLNGAWSFSDEVISSPEQVRWTQTIEVPFPPESPRSGLDNRQELYEVVWYQREFELPEAWREKQILLHFGAVDYRAEVWVNGRFVISHEGGHTPFTADITDQLEGERQTVTVRVEDDPYALDKPRGKQDWQAHPPPHLVPEDHRHLAKRVARARQSHPPHKLALHPKALRIRFWCRGADEYISNRGCRSSSR